MANEPLKVERKFWKVQVKRMDYRAKPMPNIPQTQKYRDGVKLSCSRILSDGEF